MLRLRTRRRFDRRAVARFTVSGQVRPLALSLSKGPRRRRRARMAEMDEVEASGRTVEEAINKALKQLGLEHSQVEVEVLNEGRGGILGLGAEQARVIVRPAQPVAAASVTETREDEG